jgi:hypothetical protein
MSFTYNTNIPAASHNPSDDQPLMETNTNSINSWVQTDHYGFGTGTDGWHLQTTLPAFSSGTLPGTIPGSVAYPAAGIADSTHAQYYFKTPSIGVPLSSVRAFASFVALGGGGGSISIPPGAGINVATITQAGTAPFVWTITLSANATVGNNVCVFAFGGNSNTGFSFTYSFASNVLTLKTTAIVTTSPVSTINIAILQI